MDDFMEKLLQEVSKETDGLNIDQPLPQPQNVSQAMPRQNDPAVQIQNSKPGMVSNISYSQSTGIQVAFEDVSYLPDAGEGPAVRPLPGVEDLVREAKKAEAYDEKQRNNEKQAAAVSAPASTELSEQDIEKIVENIQNIVHTETEKSTKSIESVIYDVSRNVMESSEKIDSLNNTYKMIIVLLIFNAILGIILVLHNFFGVI